MATRCDSCGHTHAGRNLAFVCIGCPCEHKPATAGERGVVRVAVRATMFGRWAVHPAVTWVGESDGDRHYVVTFVANGLTLPTSSIPPLDEEQACALAAELDALGDMPDPQTREGAESVAKIKAAIERVLGLAAHGAKP